MEPVPENIRLLRGACWLAKLRWAAIVCVFAGTFISSNVLNIALRDGALYAIATLLSIYNIIVLVLLNRLARVGQEVSHKAVKRIINLQISADLFLLTVLLHFSGGIENPLVFFFIFHMVIASILLSARDSYLQATLAVLLFGLLVLLEHKELIPHYCLTGFVPHCLQKDMLYTLGTFLVFTTVFYLTVYMANYIATRLKHTEHAYRQANTMLQEKDRIKDEYVSRVTHDIKGHLATIQGCLRAVKLTNFVRALLRLTQMRLSNKLEMDAFSLSKALQNVVSAVQTKADDKSITLICNVETSVEKIFGNQFSIEEMIANLLLNAIKYTPANGTVKVSAKSNEDCVLVEIADTGIGIPKEEQSRIFDEFFRATNARRAERDGTGLGLSIVKYIVERHGGQILVESEEGAGTAFKLSLPKMA
ncbi:MAG: sensor histidine kinase [Planctomycetota bacterium]|jgi:signal transduction histidine kinase